MQYSKYKEAVALAVRNLAHNNYIADEYNSFKRLMQREVQVLQELGHQIFQTNELTVSCMGKKDMTMVTTNINDLWKYPPDAEMISIAVNNGQLIKTPWDELLFPEDGSIDGVAVGINIPEEFLTEWKNVRVAAVSYLGTGPHTLATMKKTLSNTKVHASLCGFSRSWKLMSVSLMEHLQ